MTQRFFLIQGSKKHRRWMKKSITVRYAAMDRELPKFYKVERGWLPVMDPEDGYVYPHHWLNHKPLIHKGRKP